MQNEDIFRKEAFIHYNYFINIARKLTRDEYEAEDLVQDTFIRAYKFIHLYQPGSNAKAWLYRIMKNLFINLSRKKQNHPHYSLDTVNYDPAYDHAEPRLRYYEIIKLMEMIKDEYRTVITLYHLEEMSLYEIAQKLNWPLGTVKSRLHRARLEFRKILFDAI